MGSFRGIRKLRLKVSFFIGFERSNLLGSKDNKYWVSVYLLKAIDIFGQILKIEYSENKEMLGTIAYPQTEECMATGVECEAAMLTTYGVCYYGIENPRDFELFFYEQNGKLFHFLN